MIANPIGYPITYPNHNPKGYPNRGRIARIVSARIGPAPLTTSGHLIIIRRLRNASDERQMMTLRAVEVIS